MFPDTIQSSIDFLTFPSIVSMLLHVVHMFPQIYPKRPQIPLDVLSFPRISSRFPQGFLLMLLIAPGESAKRNLRKRNPLVFECWSRAPLECSCPLSHSWRPRKGALGWALGIDGIDGSLRSPNCGFSGRRTGLAHPQKNDCPGGTSGMRNMAHRVGRLCST